MGGLGSSRWRGHTPRPLVEEFLCFDFASREWRRVFREQQATGWVSPSSPSDTDPTEFMFRLYAPKPDGSRRLTLDDGGLGRELTLEPVRVGFDERMYPRCPGGCGKRSRKVYASPKDPRFTCRECAGLGYLSEREHDARIDQARRDLPAFLGGRAHLTSANSFGVGLRITFEAIQRGLNPAPASEMLAAWAARNHESPEDWLEELEFLRRVSSHRLPVRLDKRETRVDRGA